MNLQSFALLGNNNGYKKPLEFKPIIDQWIGEWKFIYNVGSKFYYLTNYKAPFKRIVTLDVNYPQEENWREILVGDEDNIIESVSIMDKKAVVKYLSQAANTLKVYDINNPMEKAQLLHEVELPGRGSIEEESSAENAMLFSYQTYTEPTKLLKMDMKNYSLETLFDSKFFKEKTGYDPEDYISDHVEFESKDGTKVPLTLIRKKETLPSLDSAKAD